MHREAIVNIFELDSWKEAVEKFDDSARPERLLPLRVNSPYKVNNLRRELCSDHYKVPYKVKTRSEFQHCFLSLLSDSFAFFDRCTWTTTSK